MGINGIGTAGYPLTGYTAKKLSPNAPQEVKDAWMDAAEEVNANGVRIRGNGMMSHISQNIPNKPQSDRAGAKLQIQVELKNSGYMEKKWLMYM